MKFILNIFIFCVALLANNQNDIKIGDLILREGTTLDSQLIKQFFNATYTHIGIISCEKPLKVLHATYDDLGKNGVVEFSWEDFLKGAKKIKIIRLDIENKNDILDNLKKQIGKEFKISTQNDNLYCTTFLWNELKKYIKVDLKYDKINIPFNQGYYLLPERFLDLEHTLIYENNLL